MNSKTTQPAPGARDIARRGRRLNPLVKVNKYFPDTHSNMWASDFRELFGLKASATLPDEFRYATHNGPRGPVNLFIAPKDFTPCVNPKSNRAHRIFAYCTLCGRAIPVGRMNQHYGRKDHQEEAS